MLNTDRPHRSPGGNCDTDVIIVGAGVSGLATARALTRAGLRCLVAEARNRLGGRVEGVPGYPSVDLGPAWFWPHHRHVAGALRDLSLCSFVQAADGETVIDRGQGTVPQRAVLPDPEGSPHRVFGGVSALVRALANCLEGGALRLVLSPAALNASATIGFASGCRQKLR